MRSELLLPFVVGPLILVYMVCCRITRTQITNARLSLIAISGTSVVLGVASIVVLIRAAKLDLPADVYTMLVYGNVLAMGWAGMALQKLERIFRSMFTHREETNDRLCGGRS